MTKAPPPRGGAAAVAGVAAVDDAATAGGGAGGAAAGAEDEASTGSVPPRSLVEVLVDETEGHAAIAHRQTKREPPLGPSCAAGDGCGAGRLREDASDHGLSALARRSVSGGRGTGTRAGGEVVSLHLAPAAPAAIASRRTSILLRFCRTQCHRSKIFTPAP